MRPESSLFLLFFPSNYCNIEIIFLLCTIMTLIKRSVSRNLERFLQLFPIVVIVGPRQAGKTTFAKMELPKWRYFDMEKPSDFGRISSDIEFFLREYGEHCIIDEAQTFPDLFPALRNHVDSDRARKGRVVLLGSVNPLLIKNISESLAGRLGIIEITPFSFMEAAGGGKIAVEEFWLRGGYPEPLRWNEADRFTWMEQYLKTFVERDIFALLKTSLSPQEQIRLLTMMARNHGKLWNASQTAAAFGISYHTVQRYVELMETFFLVKKLIPYYQNVGKRLVKRPKIYFHDTGILHYLLNIITLEDLRTSPYRGFSFEGFVIEHLKRRHMQESGGRASFFFYRTARGEEIDLLVQDKKDLHAYEIKTSTTIAPSDLKGFRRSLDQLSIKKGTVIYFGDEDYELDRQLAVRAVRSLLTEPHDK